MVSKAEMLRNPAAPAPNMTSGCYSPA
jgi:hypothetical protein